MAKKKENRIKGHRDKVKLLVGGLANMTYKDCKRRAIVLGMPFPDASRASFPQLMTFIKNSENKPDMSLIDKYDDWADHKMEEAGISKDDPLRSYQLRYGFISEDKVTKEKTRKRIKGLAKPKKEKRQKDEHGLWKGTKKSYTYELASKGFSLDRVTRRVIKKFPDANKKSISQWYRAAVRKPNE